MNRRGSAGFTVVELMMALAIFSIGVTGLFAIQAVTVRANTNAKDVATASELARSWQERIAMDANLWGGPGDWPRSNTTWLQLLDNGFDGQWVLPAADGNFGPAAGSRGEFEADGAEAYFCTHIRLTELQANPTGLVRVDVRVFWQTVGPSSWNDGAPFCVGAANIASITQPPFDFIHHSSVVRQTPRY